MRFRIGLLCVSVLVAAACTDFRPERIAANDVCFRCRRVINDVKFGAEVIDKDGRSFKFKTPGCMAKYLKAHPDGVAAIFATDFATSRLVKVNSLTFVPVIYGEGRDKQPDFAGFSSTSTARTIAEREKTSTIEWKEILAKAVAE